MLNVPFVLASTSPRRIDILKSVGIPALTLAPAGVDETPMRGEEPKALVRRLSLAKARSVVPGVLRAHGGAFVLAADTIVVSPAGKGGGKILNKPRDTAEAQRMLKTLSGRTHTVHTGYCILAAAREEKAVELKRVVTSRVTMRRLSAADIKAYVASGEPMDKAGAYGAQGMGMALIEKITGSYMNVVGLPIAQVLQDLEERFEIPLFGWGKE